MMVVAPVIPNLDVDLVAQHGRSEDHGLGSSLELLPHVDGLLKGVAPLVHVAGVQDLTATSQTTRVVSGKEMGRGWQKISYRTLVPFQF